MAKLYSYTQPKNNKNKKAILGREALEQNKIYTPKNTITTVTPKSTNITYSGFVGPKLPEPLQSYPTSNSSSSGSSGYGSLASAYLDAYNAQVQAAKNANDQTLKNLSDAYNRYREDYTTNKSNLENTYNTTEKNLLKSLQRFQEQNAEDVKNQKQSFLTNQSALESARAEADRQARINMASRGLAGSGLQQLAQLQTLMSQGQDISNLANANQSEMDKLRKALTEATEDYNDDLANAQKTRDTAISALDTELKRKGEDYATAVENANTNLRDLLAKYAADLATNRASTYASYGSGSSSDSDLDVITGGLETSELNLADALNSLKNMSNKEVKNTYKKSFGTTDRAEIAKKLYENAVQESRAYRTNYGNKYRNTYNVSENNLKTILRNAGY